MTRSFIFLFFFIPLFISGQNTYFLCFNAQQDSFYYTQKTLKFNSKKDVNLYLDKLRNKHIKDGFVLASIDSINWVSDTVFVEFYTGDKFSEIKISYDESDRYIIRKIPRVNERLISKFPFNPMEVESLLRKLNDYLNNSGYPFSKVYLDVDRIKADRSDFNLIIERGPLVNIKEILIKGESKIQKKFIQNAISIKEGDIYNAQLIRDIPLKISQILFLKEIRSHEILFTPEGAELFLYLESVPVSSVNGIVGLQPNSVTGKSTITGDIRLKLLNTVKRGEELQINWRSLQPQTQDLDIRFNFPFLFNTPFGIDTRFNLYKLDSTFLKTEPHIGIRYYLSGDSYLKAFYQGDNSNLLSGSNSYTTGNLSSISTNSYGLGLFRNRIDYLPNPQKGFILSMDISAGRRKSAPLNSDSTFFSTTFKGNLNIEVFVPITFRHVIRLANHTGTYFAPEVYQNELFRFGGLSKQRGFNEETLFASTFTTFILEYRFLVDQNSHAFIFFDQSMYENNSSKYLRDTPFGFGVGYSFGTNLGIFSISYALGKQFNNPIQIRDGKVHFGYIAYF